MELIIAKSLGFCFGVNRAIECVYNEATKNKIYTFGPITHNKQIINDLEQKGVKIVEKLDDIKENRTVIIRSHGISPLIYSELDKKNIKYIDCTCPCVKKIHNIVEKNYKEGYYIIIIGDKLHPEIIGINGWCENTGIIINSIEEANNIELSKNKKYIIVSQTTFSKEKFSQIISILKNKSINFDLYNTICNATTERQMEAIEISKKVDKMLVIGDKNSSNTQKLYEICKKNCEKTYYIETIKDLQLNIFKTNDRIGITAGASTPSAIIKEAIKTMNELNQASNESFEQMLESSFVTLHTGDIVKGTVIQVANEEVSVNLGYKSDGIIEKGEISNDPKIKASDIFKPGDEIEVFIIRVNDSDGNVLLSTKRIENQKGIKEIEKAFEEKTQIKGKLTEVVKGGMIANINGIRAFVPSSQLSNKYVENLNKLLGKEYNFNVIEFTKGRRGKIVVGRKELAEIEVNNQKKELFSKISVGQEIKGTVNRITDFGAFINLGGIDGLVHISEMSWERINKPQDLLKVGQIVDVIVLDINEEKGKISLSLKNPKENPWNIVLDKYKVGDIVEGRVVRLVSFGAFVEIVPGVDGLIHISQISNKHIAKVEDALSIGDVIKIKILEINEENKKISLSKKDADGIVLESENSEDTISE